MEIEVWGDAIITVISSKLRRCHRRPNLALEFMIAHIEDILPYLTPNQIRSGRLLAIKIKTPYYKEKQLIMGPISIYKLYWSKYLIRLTVLYEL